MALFSELPFRGIESPKITVIEGADGSGKTTMIKEIISRYDNDPSVDLRVLRFPDNHGPMDFRAKIMSKEMEQNPDGLMFLFMCDFVYTFNTQIEPHIHKPTVRFVLDRFVPSTCIYQSIDLMYLNFIFENRFENMVSHFKDAEYIYLVPQDLDSHRARLAQKKGEEVNHLDPVGDEAILHQMRKYSAFMERQREIGILGSYNVKSYSV